jgi:hypothetical protein
MTEQAHQIETESAQFGRDARDLLIGRDIGIDVLDLPLTAPNSQFRHPAAANPSSARSSGSGAKPNVDPRIGLSTRDLHHRR